MAHNALNQIGARSLTTALLDNKKLKEDADIQDIMKLPQHLLKQTIQNLRTDLRVLKKSNQDYEQYYGALDQAIPPVDLKAYLHSAFSDQAGIPRRGGEMFNKASLVLQSSLGNADLHLSTWDILSDPRTESASRFGEIGVRCSQTAAIHEIPPQALFQTEIDFGLEGGRFTYKPNASVGLQDMISSPLLFHRLRSMGFGPMAGGLRVVLRNENDGSEAELIASRMMDFYLYFHGSSDASRALCDLFTFLCGPSWDRWND